MVLYSVIGVEIGGRYVMDVFLQFACWKSAITQPTNLGWIWSAELKSLTDFHSVRSFSQNSLESVLGCLELSAAKEGGSFFGCIVTCGFLWSGKSWIERLFDLGMVVSSCLITAPAHSSWKAIPGVVWIDPAPEEVSTFLSMLSHQNIVGTWKIKNRYH